MKKVIAMIISGILIVSLTACSGSGSGSSAGSAETESAGVSGTTASEVTAEVQTTAEETEAAESLRTVLPSENWELHRGYSAEGYESDVEYYSLERVVYCASPVDEAHQIMNIYVPACYMKEDENGVSIDPDGSFSGNEVNYSAEDAPVIYLNTIAGFGQAEPADIESGRQGHAAGSYAQLIENGFVLVTVGARGMGKEGEEINTSGLIPAGIVDLKAGIRFLRAHDAELAGSSEKIVTIGSSSGGGFSALLGASGNSPVYEPFLEEIGAEEASDSVWASVVYCPVTTLEIADGGYWWQNGAKTKESLAGELTRCAVKEFVTVLREQGFDISEDGYSGEYYEGFRKEFSDIFNSYIAYCGMNEAEADEFIKAICPDGNWLYINEAGEAEVSSVPEYAFNYWGDPGSRMAAGVYDSFSGNGGSAESKVYDHKHFSTVLADAFEDILEAYPDAKKYAESYRSDIDNYLDTADLFEPEKFIRSGETDMAQHWRFRSGSEDANSVQSISWYLYQTVLAAGAEDADYGILYGFAHETVEYDPLDLVNWINGLDTSSR